MKDIDFEASVAELREITAILLDHLSRSTGGSVVIREDYYWSVPSGALFEVLGDPPELTIGQLIETIAHLREVRVDESNALGYHLVWLGDIFRAIGSTYPA